MNITHYNLIRSHITRSKRFLNILPFRSKTIPLYSVLLGLSQRKVIQIYQLPSKTINITHYNLIRSHIIRSERFLNILPFRNKMISLYSVLRGQFPGESYANY